jgi:crossover junction endodeoxyribonuclease RuvC
MKKVRSGVYVLGLDPGTQVTGWAIVCVSIRGVQVRGAGSLKLGNGDLPGRLVELDYKLRDLARKWSWDHAAIESGYVSFGKRANPPSQLALAEARGVCKVVALTHGRHVEQYKPAQVKIALTGNGQAEKADMIRFVDLRFKWIADEDTADAIGVAVCHAERMERKGLWT